VETVLADRHRATTGSSEELREAMSPSQAYPASDRVADARAVSPLGEGFSSKFEFSRRRASYSTFGNMFPSGCYLPG
jgi:hypothetical protein